MFDLFGTLVPQFPREAHDRVLAECSSIVGLDAGACLSAWRRLYGDRVTGRVSGIEGHLDAVAREASIETDPDRIRRAVDQYRRFAHDLVTASEETLQVLDALSSGGVTLGLLSNAHEDVASAFGESKLARFFAAVTFSCRIGYRKPHRRAFAVALESLGRPSQVTFVGDGSDDELTGAAIAGFRPVLLRGDLTDAYDPDRPEVAAWSGASIDELAELIPLLGCGE